MEDRTCRYKVLDATKYGSMEITIVDTETGETMKKTKNGARVFAIKNPVEGIVLDGRRFVSATPVDFHKYLVKEPDIDYDVVRFFNRLCLEIDDIPEEVREMALAVKSGTEYTPSASFSHYDDAVSLHNDYQKIKNLLPPEALYGIIFDKDREDTIFKKVFDKYSRYASELWKNGRTPDGSIEWVMEITGLPSWYRQKVVDDLYCIAQ